MVKLDQHFATHDNSTIAGEKDSFEKVIKVDELRDKNLLWKLNDETVAFFLTINAVRQLFHIVCTYFTDLNFNQKFENIAILVNRNILTQLAMTVWIKHKVHLLLIVLENLDVP